MKLPLFKRSTADRLRAETAASASAAARLVDLRADRDHILNSDTDDLAAVIAADAAVAAQEKIVVIHQQRMQSLDRELRDERTADREKRKATVVEKVAQGFAARTKAAADLEAALAKLADAYLKYIEASRSATAAWDGSLLPPQAGQFALSENITSVLAMQLRIEPGSAHVMLSECGVRTEGIAQRAASFSESFIQSLREAPLPETFEDEERAA